MHISANMGLGMEMGCMREMADALWEGHTLLKTGLSAHRHTHTQTDRQTKVKTVYPPISLRSLDGYNKRTCATFAAKTSTCILWSPKILLLSVRAIVKFIR